VDIVLIEARMVTMVLCNFTYQYTKLQAVPKSFTNSDQSMIKQ